MPLFGGFPSLLIPVLLAMAEGTSIRVLVNIGVMVTVIMDQAAYRRESPHIGDTVRLTFGSIRFL